MPIYMRVGGIDGDSTNEQYKNWFELMSYDWGASMEGGTGGGGGAGKVSFQDLHFTKITGKGSPLLMLTCANGKHIPSVNLAVTSTKKEKPEIYLKITLSDVLISSYRQSGDASSPPVDEVSMTFAKIEFSQAVYKPNGSYEFQTASWDLKNNRGG